MIARLLRRLALRRYRRELHARLAWHKALRERRAEAAIKGWAKRRGRGS